MKVTSWQCDISTLPGWEARKGIPYVFNEYFEIPQSDTLCCFYGVAEASMLRYQGYLAVYRNRENPQLVVSLAEGFAFWPGLSVSRDGRYLFLQPQVQDGQNRSVIPILILDMQKNRFACVPTDNGNPAYTVWQKSKAVFEILADEKQRQDPGLRALHGKKLRLRWLRWRPFAQLQTFSKQ